MSRNSVVSHQIVMKSRPVGKPVDENFEAVDVTLPTIADGQVLLKNLYLSLDPYMRGRMSDAPSYAAPLEIGDVMLGGTVARVVESRNDTFQAGDLVLAFGGWQTHVISDGMGLNKLDPAMAQPSMALGVLGMPGFTAYMGLLDIGAPKPGETVVVAAASGAVGSVVGQIARLKGCRAVGIAGGPEKCAYVVEELGFDACVDHNSPTLKADLKAVCQNGIDVYFENVGGKVFDAVLPLLNTKARIPVCGVIATYNDTKLPEGPDRLGLLAGTILRKRIRMQGFIIFDDYGAHYGTFLKEMSGWVKDGKIKFREDVVEGLDNAPRAFMGLLEGRNFGKLVVKIGE